jgi:hypothetical protein
MPLLPLPRRKARAVQVYGSDALGQMHLSTLAARGCAGRQAVAAILAGSGIGHGRDALPPSSRQLRWQGGQATAAMLKLHALQADGLMYR